MSRVTWKSRLGFILAASGSAIGLGAIWKFPYIAAENGGGIFLLLFFAICFTLGLAIMLSEMVVGQVSTQNPAGAYRYFGGTSWSLVGYLGVLCGFLILSFYSVVGGWTLFYLLLSIKGQLVASDPGVLRPVFETFISHPTEPLWYHAGFMALTAGIVMAGVQDGIERMSKILMSGLFLLILVLIVRALTLPGAMAGLSYFLTPDASRLNARMLIEAAGLAFFSLSLGMGCMITYGSYIPDGVRIGRSALCVVALTAMTCLLSGLIIIPALFAFGFSPAEGPGLTFIVMPALFSRMTGGTFFAVLFFVLLLVAALTSSVSLMEVVTRFFMDEMGMRRTPVCLLMSLCMFVVGIAASLSFGVWQHHTLFGMTFFQLLDSVTSCLMMPFGGAMVALLVGWKAWNSLAGKLTSDLSPRFALLLKITCRFFAPIIIAAIVLQGFWFALSSAATG